MNRGNCAQPLLYFQVAELRTKNAHTDGMTVLTTEDKLLAPPMNTTRGLCNLHSNKPTYVEKERSDSRPGCFKVQLWPQYSTFRETKRSERPQPVGHRCVSSYGVVCGPQELVFGYAVQFKSAILSPKTHAAREAKRECIAIDFLPLGVKNQGKHLLVTNCIPSMDTSGFWDTPIPNLLVKRASPKSQEGCCFLIFQQAIKQQWTGSSV